MQLLAGMTGTARHERSLLAAEKVDRPAGAKVASASAGGDGQWEPPQLQVKLTELVAEDQIAVSLNLEEEAGKGGLVASAHAASTYDVQITAAPAPALPT